MLTRYTRQGIAVDLIGGKHVGIVGPRLDIAAAAHREVHDYLLADFDLEATSSRAGLHPSARYANGASLTVHAARPDALRGYSLDVVVIVRHRDLLNLDRVRQSARPALLARDGELILA